MEKINAKIDRLLNDAENAASHAVLSNSLRDIDGSEYFVKKRNRLKAQARDLYLAHPGSVWPECEWPAPKPGKGVE